jgi:hypothetical protein
MSCNHCDSVEIALVRMSIHPRLFCRIVYAMDTAGELWIRNWCYKTKDTAKQAVKRINEEGRIYPERTWRAWRRLEW